MRAIVRAYLFWKLPKVQTKENVFLLNWWPLTFWLSRLQWNGCVDFPYFALQFLFIVIVQYNFPKLNARCIKFVTLPTCISVSFDICSKPSSFYKADFRQDPPKERIFPCSRIVFTLSDISLGWQQFALTSLLQARLVKTGTHPLIPNI